MTFLSNIASRLFAQYGEDLTKLVVVFPSRRASLFFSNELKNLIKKPVFLPTFLSIEDFVFNVNDLRRVNNIELFLEFYKIYFTSTSQAHDLEKCYKWANILLNDFDEIDKSDVNVSSLFHHLADIKRIENWGLELSSVSQNISDYLSFFDQIPTLYRELRKVLLIKNVAYSGLAQRLLVENNSKLKQWLEKKKKSKIIFVGLDALTLCQEKMINYLLEENLCDIFWDSDEYFVNNLEQESSNFLRDYNKKWPQTLNLISKDFLQIKKQINIISVSKNINQSKLLAQLLKDKIYDSKQLKKVAVILPNEDLLLSVLESIPKDIEDINVTMGYKLKHQPLMSLFFDILNLYINSKSVSSNQGGYPVKDILQLFSNPYFKSIFNPPDSENWNELTSLVKNSSFSYLNYTFFQPHILHLNHSTFFKRFFGPFDQIESLISLLKDVINFVLENLLSSSVSRVLEQELLFELQKSLDLFSQFFLTLKIRPDIKMFAKLFRQASNSLKISFQGEPLKGLQIMGLLESRTIDFDEVFILSANENDLPPLTNTNSFIPFQVKRDFCIRTQLDFDRIYANHFFNLIKRPSVSHIFYNQDTSSYSSTERSRFINQLIYEIAPLKNTNIKVSEKVVSNTFSLESKIDNLKTSFKDDFVIDKLISLCSNGISASTLNLYNACPPQFYFQKILEVNSPEESRQAMNSAVVGELIHKILKKLYEDYIDTYLDLKIMKKIQESVLEEVQRVLLEEKIENVSQGKNLLAYDAIIRIVTNFVNYETSLVKAGNKIMIKFLEKKIVTPNLSINYKTNSIPVVLKGYVDRIDIYNDTYRVVDYKTGVVRDSELKCDNIQEIREKPKVLQLLMYVLLAKTKGLINAPVSAGVISLRTVKFDFKTCVINKSLLIDDFILTEYNSELIAIIDDLFDSELPFKHRQTNESCFFCDQ